MAETEKINITDGFTEDGYIKDQDVFSEYRYRTMPSSINGCGWVAAFNLRHFTDGIEDFEEVLNEMNGMHHFEIPGPTFLYVMRKYMKKYVNGIKEVKGKENCISQAEKSIAGIIRYTEEREPHFVSYIKCGNGFRFFNVNDDMVDGQMSMEEFMTRNDFHGIPKLFYITEK